jgi:hypothetical protein
MLLFVELYFEFLLSKSSFNLLPNQIEAQKNFLCLNYIKETTKKALYNYKFVDK